PGIVQSQLPNHNLSWEKNHNFNIGVDFGLWNRLNVTLEYYTRRTKDLLMDLPVSLTTGFSSYLTNIGEVENQGVELDIRSTNIETKDFVWSTNFNLGHNRNKIIRLDGNQTEIPSGSQIRKVGMPYRTFYLIEFAGINSETGEPQFYTNTKDENGNYVKDITENVSDANYIPMKCADPKVAGGLGNNFRYKWFDLGFTLTYQFGGWSYDNWAQKTEHGGRDSEANIPIYYRDRWKNPGDNTDIERFVFNRSTSMGKIASSRRLHKTDFIRLKNLTFGVSVPSTWTRKAGIENIRIFMSGNNLLTWAKHDYYDPEAVDNGTAIWGTPPLRTLTFGLNLNF
ncbi:MAG: TonB-dependent receptor domain-containing protein, partial [Bacteroidales bacterium]